MPDPRSVRSGSSVRDWFVPASLAVAAGGLAAPHARAQDNLAALRFFGTGTDQQDRVRVRIDDNGPGPDASTPCDLGAGSFSIDFWLRGTLSDNPSAHAGGDAEFFDFRWIEGHIVVDRDIYGASSRDWGVSLAGGRVRFGTGRADAAPLDSEHTIEGSENVLTGAWRHVCVVRDASTGVKSIYVDGVLDYACPPGRSRDDLSYPNAGDPAPVTPWGPFIVLAAEKHDADPGTYPSYAGYLDEVRFWSRALSAPEVAQSRAVVLPAGTPGLVGAFRFEEGSGTSAFDSSGSGQAPGQVIAGAPGNAQWVTAAQDPEHVAPVTLGGVCPPDCNADQTLDAFDFNCFVDAFNAGDAGRADLNADTTLDAFDFNAFADAFNAGCPG